jgi:hypothetical protein
VSFVGLVCPLASSIQAPANDDIRKEFDTNRQTVTGAQAGFVCMLGIGPLFLAPMSETFGTEHTCQVLLPSNVVQVDVQYF